jgi:4-methyl-5(b-hydroxyethyl)-thiazole monophosphate biosynthesis
MVLVFLANGFEEIEALATVDVLRRAGLQVVTVGVGGQTVTGSHGIVVTADQSDSEALPTAKDGLQAVVLPGGLPGTENLRESAVVNACLDQAAADGVLLCAICAAPSVLGRKGMLQGRKATCYPGYESDLLGAECTDTSVAVAPDRITARGAGVSIPFALAITERLVSAEKATQLGEAMQCR